MTNILIFHLQLTIFTEDWTYFLIFRFLTKTNIVMMSTMEGRFAVGILHCNAKASCNLRKFILNQKNCYQLWPVKDKQTIFIRYSSSWSYCRKVFRVLFPYCHVCNSMLSSLKNTELELVSTFYLKLENWVIWVRCNEKGCVIHEML